MKFPAALLCRALLLLACAPAPPAAAQSPSKPPAAAERHFLWEVSSLTNRVYLYGTVHAGKPEWYPLPPAVEQAFDDSRVLVVEADVTDTAAMSKYGPGMTYTPPDSLKAHVPPEDYERFRKLLPRYRFPEEQVSRMKPFMAVSLLVFAEWARQGLDARHGIEQYLIRKAKAENKRIVEIEGIEAQMALMDSITEQENLALFGGTLHALETGLAAEQINGLVAAWQRGDPEAMLVIARSYNERVRGAAEFEEKFVWSRHPEMVRKIAGYLDEGRERHFIAVGSLHLAGPRGLLEQLRQRGYVVRQK